MTPAAETLDRIRRALSGLELEPEEPRDGVACLRMRRSELHAALAGLRDRAGFETLTMITAIDRLGSENAAPEPRFELVHQLRSIEHGDSVRLRTPLASDDAHAPTCLDLWPGAGFMERECWDMFGIGFDGHEPLKRLLMPEEYGHHPLRKEFPHQGIEPDRLYREWDRKRHEEAEPSR